MPLSNSIELKMTFTDIEVAEIKETFLKFDKNKNGSIELEELNNVMVSLGKTLSQEELKDLLDASDKNENGQLEFNEFLAMYEKIQKK